MTRPKLYLNLVLLLLFLQIPRAQGQNILHVVEKRIEKILKVNANEKIEIIASKAEIKVIGWEKEEAKLIIRFTSSNKDKIVAEKEMDYMKYSVIKELDKIEIQNIFNIPSTVTKINSILAVSYELWIPHKNTINITNNYGDISIKNLNAKIKVALELGNLFLSNITNDGFIEILYGDVTAYKLNGNFTFMTSRSILNIDDAEGSYSFHCAYGKINLSTPKPLNALAVAGVKTEINLSLLEIADYNLNLHTNYSNIITFDTRCNAFIKEGNRGSVILKSEVGKSRPSIKISTSYSPIVIKKYN